MICLLATVAVPQALHTKHSNVVVKTRPDMNAALLQNCGSVMISQLRAWSAAGAEGVAFSGGTCADTLDQQLKLLLGMPLRDSSIVLADRPLSAILQSAVKVRSLDHPPAIGRFPEAGPGKALIDVTTISNAVRAALTEHFKISPHRADESAAEYHAACIRAGLLLMWNQLDGSHRISQSLEGAGEPRTADYWHAIMHRREPDLGNAAYWFRSLGHHPAFDSMFADLPGWISEVRLPDSIKDIIQHKLLHRTQWDPAAVTQLCRTALQYPGSPEDQALRVVQYFEIVNLLQFSLQQF